MFLLRGLSSGPLPSKSSISTTSTSTSQASGSLPHCRGSPAQVKDRHPIAEVHQHKSSIWTPTPLQRFTSTSQGTATPLQRYPQHLNPIAEGGIHSISTPLQREVFTASQPHCRGRNSQHLNPIATASQPHCRGIHSISTTITSHKSSISTTSTSPKSSISTTSTSPKSSISTTSTSHKSTISTTSTRLLRFVLRPPQPSAPPLLPSPPNRNLQPPSPTQIVCDVDMFALNKRIMCIQEILTSQ